MLFTFNVKLSLFVNYLYILQHSRVRYAACNALGQMASDFAPVFQKKFTDKVSTISFNQILSTLCKIKKQRV